MHRTLSDMCFEVYIKNNPVVFFRKRDREDAVTFLLCLFFEIKKIVIGFQHFSVDSVLFSAKYL